MSRTMIIRYGLCAIAVAAFALSGCKYEGKAALGEPCELQNDVGANTVAVEQGNPDCKSGMCMSFLGNEFCTDECLSDADCPENMACMDMEPAGGTGAWCVLIGEGTDLEPSNPVAGSARYHADEALAAVQADWAADAHLVRVWSNGVGLSGLLVGPDCSWTYTFLSVSDPEHEAEIEITIDGAGEIWTNEYDPDFGPLDIDLLSGTLWRFDSHDLYALAAPHGAAEFWADNTDADSSYDLSGGIIMSADKAIWGVTYVASDLSDIWMELFDAETGTTISMF